MMMTLQTTSVVAWLLLCLFSSGESAAVAADNNCPSAQELRQAQLDQHSLTSNETTASLHHDCGPDSIYTNKCLLTPGDRCQALGHRGGTVWLTGCPGAGQDAVARQLEQLLVLQDSVPVVRWDQETLFQTVHRDLDPYRDGSEAVRRTGEMAVLVAHAGTLVVVSGSDQWRRDRAQVRQRHEEQGMAFVEVAWGVDTEFLQDLQQRANGDPSHPWVCVDEPYENPNNPELLLLSAKNTKQNNLNDDIDQVRDLLLAHRMILNKAHDDCGATSKHSDASSPMSGGTDAANINESDDGLPLWMMFIFVGVFFWCFCLAAKQDKPRVLPTIRRKKARPSNSTGPRGEEEFNASVADKNNQRCYCDSLSNEEEGESRTSATTSSFSDDPEIELK